MLLARLAIVTHGKARASVAASSKMPWFERCRPPILRAFRAFAVHAKDDNARSFYERFDFIASPSDPYHLFRLLKDIRNALKS